MLRNVMLPLTAALVMTVLGSSADVSAATDLTQLQPATGNRRSDTYERNYYRNSHAPNVTRQRIDPSHLYKRNITNSRAANAIFNPHYPRKFVYRHSGNLTNSGAAASLKETFRR